MATLSNSTLDIIKKMKAEGQSQSQIEDFFTREIGYHTEVISLIRKAYISS